MPLDDPLPAEVAFRPWLGARRAGLALVSLQADPELEHLAAAVARQEGAAAALQLFLPTPWRWHCRARGERQLPVIVATIVLQVPTEDLATSMLCWTLLTFRYFYAMNVL